MIGRVQKIVANSGYCSRRRAEELIRAGSVSVNGKPAKIGDSADSNKDRIIVEGKPLGSPRKIYLILNKPVGVETTLHSTSRKPTVIDIVRQRERVIPAGRLDVDSHGLVILTNDGELANRIMHPRYEIDKVYHARIIGIVPDEGLERLKRGIQLDEGKTSPAEVTVLRRAFKTTEITIKIHEGRNRQIRRMVEAIGFKVAELSRIRVGPLTLRGLRVGQFRDLREKEVKELKRALGMI